MENWRVEAMRVLPVSVENEPREVVRSGIVPVDVTSRVCVLTWVPCRVEKKRVEARRVLTVAVEKMVALLMEKLLLCRVLVVKLERKVDWA